MIGIDDELRELRTRLRTFIDGEVTSSEPVLDAGGSGARQRIAELRQMAKERGLWALGHPVEIGGQGIDLVRFALLNEVIGRSHHGQTAVGSDTMQDAIMLARHGTEQQRQHWLEPMVRGDIHPSVGLTEPEVAGSDPTLIQSTGYLDGDHWVINAHKWFTTGASTAAFTTVFVKTDPDAPRHLQFSSIIVPRGTPGFEVSRVIPTMGHVGGDHCEIRLIDVRVPAANLLGPRGQGFVIAQDRLGPGRLFHAMRWMGQAQRAFELMCERANDRFAHGSILAEKGEIRRYVAESVAEIQAARMLTMDAARALASGHDARVQLSLVKFWAARVLHDVIDRAIQVHGALGVTGYTPLERMYREARYARIYDGPDEVHRMQVARRVLARPSAVPWSDDSGT